VLVLDTSVAEEIAAAPTRRSLLRDEVLIAPPLLWSEARSNLHERVHRGDLERTLAILFVIRVARRSRVPAGA
jgi:hypothetical protein